MAKRQVVSYSYTCDVCGGTIPESDGAGATRTVRWEGVDFALDVCAAHGSQLGDALTQLKGFVDAGRRESGRRGRRPAAVSAAPSPSPSGGPRAATSPPTSGTSAKRADVATIRAWAREKGMKVSERGRIPATLMSAYDAAMSAPAASEPAAATRKRRARKAAASA